LYFTYVPIYCLVTKLNWNLSIVLCCLLNHIRVCQKEVLCIFSKKRGIIRLQCSLSYI
jgi:hypothetical protein